MSNEAITMTVYVYGKQVKYCGDKKPQFRPACDVTMMWYGDCFRETYFTKFRAAVRALADLQDKCREDIKELDAYFVRKDIGLFERMEKCACTQDDSRLPYYLEFSDKHRHYEYCKFVLTLTVGKKERYACVTRLNTLPTQKDEEGAKMRKEIYELMEYFGYCSVCWSCMGHTRAMWQTEAVCDWVEREHPEWKVTNNGSSCYIEFKNLH